MTKEAIKLLYACLPKADNIDAFLASVEEQTKDDLKSLVKADPIECMFSCNACPDFNCVCNLSN